MSRSKHQIKHPPRSERIEAIRVREQLEAFKVARAGAREAVLRPELAKGEPWVPHGSAPAPLLVLELGGVTWRALDRLRETFPNIKRFLEASRTFTTLGNAAHGVGSPGAAVWRDYRAMGYSVGIYGAPDGWGAENPGPGGFYVPESFKRGARCYPSYLEPLGRIGAAAEDTENRLLRVGTVLRRDLVGLVRSLPKLGISRRSVGLMARHLIEKRVVHARDGRWPVFQGALRWDIFKRLYRPGNPPMFSVFRATQVAAVLESYWAKVMTGRAGITGIDRDTMFAAAAELDHMLGDVLAFREANPRLAIVLDSALGQGGEGALAVVARGLQPRDSRTAIRAGETRHFFMDLGGVFAAAGKTGDEGGRRAA